MEQLKLQAEEDRDQLNVKHKQAEDKIATLQEEQEKRFSESQEQLKGKNQAVKDAKAESDRLEGEYQEQLMASQQEKDELQQKVNLLSSQVREKESTLKAFEEDLEAANFKITQMKEEHIGQVGNASDEVEHLRQQLDQQEAANAELKKSTRAQELKIGELTAQVDDLNALQSKAKFDIEQSQYAFKNVTNKLAEVEMDIQN